MTITPEDRELFRTHFKHDCNIPHLLDALEAAEAQATYWEQEVSDVREIHTRIIERHKCSQREAEKARDWLAKLVASGGFDCPGHDGECPYGGGEDACICKSTEMGSDMRCWVDWAHQQSSQKD